MSNRIEHYDVGGRRGRGGVGRRGGVRGRRRRGGGRRRAPTLSNEIRATIIDHVINRGLTLREAGQRVQPNIPKSTVASIVNVVETTEMWWKHNDVCCHF